jgi:hypothetical protein
MDATATLPMTLDILGVDLGDSDGDFKRLQDKTIALETSGKNLLALAATEAVKDVESYPGVLGKASTSTSSPPAKPVAMKPTHEKRKMMEKAVRLGRFPPFQNVAFSKLIICLSLS